MCKGLSQKNFKGVPKDSNNEQMIIGDEDTTAGDTHENINRSEIKENVSA